MAGPGDMKLIVGLGNPGRKYASTRHNVGFAVAYQLAAKFGLATARSRFHGETVEVQWGTQRGLLLCPHTYMNRSGLSVAQACQFYQLELADVLVVCDDFQLPLGKLRFRARGSSGDKRDYRMCCGAWPARSWGGCASGSVAPPDGWDVADYVLSKFTTDEQPLVEQTISRAAEAVVDWVHSGIDVCMNRYNAESSAAD